MQGIFQKENTDKALKYGIYRHLPTYEKIIRNLVSFCTKMMYKASSQEVAQEYSFEMNAYNSSNDFEIVLRIATFRHDAETLDEIMHKEVLL